MSVKASKRFNPLQNERGGENKPMNGAGSQAAG